MGIRERSHMALAVSMCVSMRVGMHVSMRGVTSSMPQC
jgi:hypothetical protein